MCPIYQGQTGVLSGKTIVIVYLFFEPELYFYLTLAEVFRQVRHSINNVSWVALFGRVLNHIWGLLYHFLIIATLTLPYVQQLRRAYWRRLHLYYVLYMWLLIILTQIEITHTSSAQLNRMWLNFSDLRGTGVSLILTPHIYLFLPFPCVVVGVFSCPHISSSFLVLPLDLVPLPYLDLQI